MLLQGCFTKKKPVAHIGNAAYLRPAPPQAVRYPDLGESPNIELEVAPMPPKLGTARSGPARPKVIAPPATAATPEKPRETLLVPELSDAELAAARADSQKSLDYAENTLAGLRGRRLSAAETDTASKIQGFVDAAKEAIKDGDWQRARSQAKKAEVLAQQLRGGN